MFIRLVFFKRNRTQYLAEFFMIFAIPLSFVAQMKSPRKLAEQTSFAVCGGEEHNCIMAFLSFTLLRQMS
jgi:hypothetical protein